MYARAKVVKRSGEEEEDDDGEEGDDEGDYFDDWETLDDWDDEAHWVAGKKDIEAAFKEWEDGPPPPKKKKKRGEDEEEELTEETIMRLLERYERELAVDADDDDDDDDDEFMSTAETPPASPPPPQPVKREPVRDVRWYKLQVERDKALEEYARAVNLYNQQRSQTRRADQVKKRDKPPPKKKRKKKKGGSGGGSIEVVCGSCSSCSSDEDDEGIKKKMMFVNVPRRQRGRYVSQTTGGLDGGQHIRDLVDHAVAGGGVDKGLEVKRDVKDPTTADYLLGVLRLLPGVRARMADSVAVSVTPEVYAGTDPEVDDVVAWVATRQRADGVGHWAHLSRGGRRESVWFESFGLDPVGGNSHYTVTFSPYDSFPDRISVPYKTKQFQNVENNTCGQYVVLSIYARMLGTRLESLVPGLDPVSNDGHSVSYEATQTSRNDHRVVNVLHKLVKGQALAAGREL